MKVLAVDTSAQIASVAVVDESGLIGEFTLNHGKTHSQMLIHMIAELLSKLEMSPKDIDLFAVSIGPGSFTGLRIGVTSVKSMAYALDKPVIGVSTLDALAYGIRSKERIICPMMDARNNYVFTALYKWENRKQIKLTEYMWVNVSDLIKQLKEKNSKIIFNGDAANMHKDLLEAELGEACEFAPENLMLQMGSSVAYIALKKAAKGMKESCYDLVPFYLRKSQAEREE
jgi:tRNA threonylcarbamoyladenosine biosynthesis protein TsaB